MKARGVYASLFLLLQHSVVWCIKRRLHKEFVAAAARAAVLTLGVFVLSFKLEGGPCIIPAQCIHSGGRPGVVARSLPM
jgi:hypothetical protein